MSSVREPGVALSALPPVATIAELARALRADERTVRAACEAGEVPGALRLGRSWRVNVEVLRQTLGEDLEEVEGRVYGRGASAVAVDQARAQ